MKFFAFGSQGKKGEISIVAQVGQTRPVAGSLPVIEEYCRIRSWVSGRGIFIFFKGDGNRARLGPAIQIGNSFLSVDRFKDNHRGLRIGINHEEF